MSPAHALLREGLVGWAGLGLAGGVGPPHRSEPAGGDERARVAPTDVLRRPHLVLPDAGGPHHLVRVGCGLLVRLLDHALRKRTPHPAGLSRG
jgi:hypothetical protein